MNIESLFKNNNKSGSTIGGSFVYDAARRGQQDVLHGVKDIDKYTDRGITPVVGENLDAYLPETQSAWTKLGNSIAQTAVAELALGIPKAFADLADVIGTSIFKGNEDYTNPVSQFLEQKQEEFRNFAPIYANPDVNINNVGDASWGDKIGWFASNAPSIVSSLTLMLPGVGLIKGVSALAKLANVGARSKRLISAVSGAAKRIDEGKELTKFQRFLTSDKLAKGTNAALETVSTSAISRTVENYQEGRQTYNDMYVKAIEQFKDDKQFVDFVKRNEEQLDKDGVDKNNKDEVAKYIANKSADETFKLDYLNTVFDIIQLGALKNAWKTIRNAPNTSRKIKQANKQIAKEIGKTDEEIHKLHEGISKVSKAKDWVINSTVGSAKTIGAELSEGVEEAVNYIAQQEGMTFGNTLLTGEGVYSDFWDRVTNGFDGRLNSYLNSPELHESAFWGVLGGVMFQAGGSGVNRVYNTLLTKAAEKDSKEVQKEKRPWYWLEQLPETKRRIEEIRQRNKIYDKFRNDINQINKGIDIFQDEEQQQEGQLGTEELKEAARQRAFNDYITDITMNAINNGNYNLLKAYLEDDNVRKGMIESGLFNGEGKTSAEIESDSKAFIDNAVKKMDEVAKEYDKELVALNYITAGRKFKGRVPEEFLGIIAVDNIKARQAIKHQEDTINAINANIAEEKAAISQDTNRAQLDPSVDYERLVKLNTMAIQLGYLRDQRKKTAKAPDSVGKQITLANIDRQIEDIEANIKDEELYYVTANSLRTTFNEKGEVSTSNTDDFLDYYNNVIIGTENAKEGSKIKFDQLDAELLHLPVKAISAPTDTTRHAHKLVEQDANEVNGKLKSISEVLYKAYQDKAYAEMRKNYLQTMINRTDANVARRVGELTNTFNVARNNAIRKKRQIMTELYLKHGNIIRDIVKAEYNGDGKTLKNLYSKLDSKTVTTIKDVLKVFDFTKTANQDIALELERAFDIVDRDETAKKDRAKQNGEIENTTNQEAVSDEENVQTEESSHEPQTSNTGQPVTPQGQPTPTNQQQQQPQSQPQNVSNGVQQNPQQTPTSTPQQNTTKKKINIPHFTDSGVSSYSKEVDIENNNDGTFSIINSELSDLNNNDLYDTDGVVLTRPYEIEQKPIVTNQGGDYVLSQRGKVVNTDTVEYQQRKAQEAQAAQQSSNPSTGDVVGQNAGQPNVTPANQPVGNQRVDTVPEAQSAPVRDYSFNKDIETALEQQHYSEKLAADKLRKAMMPTFLAKKVAKEDLNIEELFDTVVDALVQKGENREILESQKTVITSMFNHLNKAKNNKLQSSTDDLIIQSTTGLFETSNGKQIFRLDYTKSVDSLIAAYCDEFGIPTVNGKKYINFEDLLRYLNSFSEDKLTSSIVYYGLNEYLKTPEAKAKYVRTDELNDNLDEAEANIRKTEEQRQIEIINENLPQRINLNSSVLLNNVETEEEANALEVEMEEAYNNSNVGDTLTYEVDGNNRVIFKTKDGKIIGSNTIPQIDSKSGERSLKVTGIIYKLNKDSHGTLLSPTKDLIYRWFTEDSIACNDLRNILYRFAYEELTPEERINLAKHFASNPEVKQAIEDGNLTDISTDVVEAQMTLNHLSKLFKFRNSKNTLDNNELRRSLNSWFDKVYDNYESAIYLSQHPGTEIKISNISEGSLIKNSNNPTDEDLTPVKDSIAGGVNPTVNKLTVTDKNNQTLVSGSYPVSNGFRKDTRHITVLGRNGNREYVLANAAKLADSFIGEDAKEIISELKSHIHKLLTDYANNKNVDTFNALKDFLLNAFNYNEHSSLFYNAKCYVTRQSNNKEFIIIKNTVNNYQLRIGLSENTIDVFRPDYPAVKIDKGTYNKKKVPLNDATVFENIDKILADLRFNISPTLINSDSVSEDAKVSGIVSKRSNQFTIRIGEKTWTYNSFNEFMLNNNLVIVNTHPNEKGTSNFERNEFSTLEYSITPPEQTSTPVEDTQPTQPVVITPSLSKYDRAIGILNGTIPAEHKGIALFTIFKEVNGKLSEKAEKELNAIKTLNLLPKNIIFDENFNKNRDDNAEIDLKTGTITVGSKWLELFNTNRSYAMRVLIHEQLHRQLNLKKNKGFIKSIKDIFDEFEKSISKESIRKYYNYCKEHGISFVGITDNEAGIEKLLASINKFKYEQYKDPDIRLEEFLVDSLMNNQLIMYLNSVDVEDAGKKTRSNLFKRILEKLAEIFNWFTEKGSLREKEINSLRNILEEPKATNKKVSKERLNNQPMIPGLFDEVEQGTSTEIEQTEKQKVEQEDEVKIEEPEQPVVEIDEDYDISDDDSYDEEDTDMADRFRNRESSTDELTTTYTPEMQSIKQQAIANGTFMKAPNGKPTNLNERQWLQVRTKSFKAWFGDWEIVYSFNKLLNNDFTFNLEAHNDKYHNYSIGAKVNAENPLNNLCIGTSAYCIGILENLGFKPHRISFISESPVMNTGISHKVALFKYNGKLYIYDMPQTEFISKTDKTFGNNNQYYEGVIINNYKPRLIELTEENLINNYGTSVKEAKRVVEDQIDNNWKDSNEASKVVDENGEPLVVYHGTAEDFNTFKTDIDLEINDQQGNLQNVLNIPNSIYATSNEDMATTYYENESFLDKQLDDAIERIYELEYEGVIISPEERNNRIKEITDVYNKRKKFLTGRNIPLFVNIKNVKVIDAKNSNWNKINDNGTIKSTRQLEDENRDKDGVIIYNVFDFGGRGGYIGYQPSTVFIINKANNVKSATSNTGEFSSENDDIRYSSTDELTVTTASSFLDAQSQLPIELRSNFASLVDSAVIRSQCK